MNWLQRLAQVMPPTYMGVGHGYRWNEDTEKYEELWQSKDNSPVILWYYRDGKLEEQTGYDAHWLEHEDAKGRIETGKKRGSITFRTDDLRLQKRILNALVDKYPGIRFGVYGIPRPMPLQDYWSSIG